MDHPLLPVKGLLAPPRREGRRLVRGRAPGRLARIRTLQQRGFTLATIARLVSGDLDAADEALLGQLSGLEPFDRSIKGTVLPRHVLTAGRRHRLGSTYTLDELASATACRWPCWKALEAEGLLIPTRVAGQARFTEEDVAASQAGLRLLEWGIPLTDLLDLARRHNEATEATARQAVEMFARHIREPLRAGVRPDALSHPDHATGPLAGRTGDPAVDGLLQAYGELLPGSPPWSATTSAEPWCGSPSTTSSGKAPTRNAERCGTGSAPPGATPVPWMPHRARHDDRSRRGRGTGRPDRVRGGHLPRDGLPGPGGRSAHRRRQDGAGAVDVRRHRPALRPGQPDHDLRPRHPLAQAVARGAGPPGRHHRPRPGLWHR